MSLMRPCRTVSQPRMPGPHADGAERPAHDAPERRPTAGTEPGPLVPGAGAIPGGLADNGKSDQGEHYRHPDHNRGEHRHAVTRGVHTPGLSRLRAPRPIHEGAELCGAARAVRAVMFAHAWDCSGIPQVRTGYSTNLAGRTRIRREHTSPAHQP